MDPAKNIPESNALGGWEEEGVSKKIIREYVGWGPKCYSIKTEKRIVVKQPNGTFVEDFEEVTKLKGIRQTMASQGITHDFMKGQLLRYLNGGDVETTMIPQWGIKTQLCREGLTVITSDHYSKELKLMGDGEIKGFRKMDGVKRDPKVFPFGYVN